MIVRSRPPSASSSKRKRADTISDNTPVRASVNGRRPWEETRPDDGVPFPNDMSSSSASQLHGMRLSNMRTSVGGEDRRNGASSSHSSRNDYLVATGPTTAQSPRSFPTTPQLSFDINALYSGEEISGLPFAYAFLEDDVVALLDNVIGSEPTGERFEDNAQVLWEAFHGQPDAPFTSSSRHETSQGNR